MIHENIELTGSFNVNDTLVIPTHAATSSALSATGSIYNDSTENVVKLYTGTEWIVVGDQTNPPPSAIEYLLVAGGGGGGGWGGGGGAGGLLSGSTTDLSSGSDVTVTVGAGGTGPGRISGYVAGNDGSVSSLASSTITTVSTVGGGGGGYYNSYNGRAGGSGGGGGIGSTSGDQNAGGSGTVGQGNNGGIGGGYPGGVHYDGGGGGGGAGAAGSNGLTSGYYTGGDGGVGIQSSITGTATYYAGGGGGHTDGRGASQGTSTGGSGGGGNGGNYNTATDAQNGTINTGGGGGSAYGDNTYGNAGDGGSGVAIFAYNNGSFNCAGGIVGDAGNGKKYHQFNQSGTFKVGSTSDLSIVTSDLQLHLDAGNFDSRGTSTWTDLSGKGNNGTVTGATLGSDFFYTFDGSNDYISLAESSGASTTPHTVYGTFTGASETNWTLECWFKTSENDTDTWGTAIIGRNSSDLFGQLTVQSNKIHYLHASPGWGYVSSTSTVTDNNWHHVALVNYSDATMDLWLDGVKEATAVDSTVYYSVNTRYFKLSHVALGYTSDYTACAVAQIRLYDNNLSDAQVLQNYNATKTNFI